MLCRTYWFPLYAFVRRQGRNPHDAQDLAQEFFARLLQNEYLKSAAPEKGRFRMFLLVALKRFMANEWDHQHAQKRGGKTLILSMDEEWAESRFAAEPGLELQPDLLFDQQWAVTLLERTMTRLRDEYVATGRAKLFELLHGFLAKDESALPYAEIADADAAVDQYVPKQQFFAEKPTPALPAMVIAVTLLVYVGLPALVAALLFRGGVVLLIAGVTYVRKDGVRASRLRLLWRAMLTWSPLFPVFGVAILAVAKHLTWQPWLALTLLGLLAAVSIALPVRGLQDRLAGTWPVPR